MNKLQQTYQHNAQNTGYSEYSIGTWMSQSWHPLLHSILNLNQCNTSIVFIIWLRNVIKSQIPPVPILYYYYFFPNFFVRVSVKSCVFDQKRRRDRIIMIKIIMKVKMGIERGDKKKLGKSINWKFWPVVHRRALNPMLLTASMGLAYLFSIFGHFIFN